MGDDRSRKELDKFGGGAKCGPLMRSREDIASATAPFVSTEKNRRDFNHYLEVVNSPNIHDVLLGRGKPFQNHNGNQSMLNIVDMYRKRYHESERAFKHEIIEEVLGIIRSRGGRFLERLDGLETPVWRQVPHRMAYRKVGHAFRSNARRISMEKRDQALSQSAKAFATPIVDTMIQRKNTMQRTPIPGIMLSGTPPLTTQLARQVAGMGMMGHLSGSVGFNVAQRNLLSQEQVLHSNRIKQIMDTRDNDGSNQARSIAVGSLVPSNFVEGNLTPRSIQLQDIIVYQRLNALRQLG